MKKIVLFFLVFGIVGTHLAQDGFRYEGKRNKMYIPFQFINNLVFIPINVNGFPLTFLLDSGVEETILFGLEDNMGINLNNPDKIKIIGLGNQDSFDGIRSTDNVLQVEEMVSLNHSLYIILGSEFNLSAHVGIPVNGIIGYSFFKNSLVEFDYIKKKLVIYKDNQRNRTTLEKKYVKVPITIEMAKPYVKGAVLIDKKKILVKLLLDNGNSDAIWLFQNLSKDIVLPENYLVDYLGQGLSGDVVGKRARITDFFFSDFRFKNPIVSFPDSIYIKNIKLIPNRIGSLGGEILKRFTVVFDYPNEFIFLKKNKNFSIPFTYNTSGIEVQQIGMQLVNEKVKVYNRAFFDEKMNSDFEKSKSNYKYELKLKPVFEISNIRNNSPAMLSGLLVGDIIISINDNATSQLSIDAINSLLREEKEKWIEIEIARNGQKLKFKFQLVNLIE